MELIEPTFIKINISHFVLFLQKYKENPTCIAANGIYL